MGILEIEGMMQLVRSALGQFLVLFLLCVEAVAQSPRGSWQPLGTLSLTESAGPYTLRVPDNLKLTTALRLTADSAGVVIDRAEVAYAAGRIDYVDPHEPMKLTAGTPSDPIAVRDVEQIVEAVTLYLRTDAARPRGRITIAGSVNGEGTLREGAGPPGTPQARGCPAGVKCLPQPNKEKFVELDVYYATTRQRAADRIKNEIKLAAFNGNHMATTTLGKAIVTVPLDRPPGTIPRPNLGGLVLYFRKEDPAKEFTLAKVDTLEKDSFHRGIGAHAAFAERFQRQALVFIHGFNVAFDDALYHGAQLTHDMNFDGPVIVFSWASRGSMLNYRYDQDAARASQNALRDVLAELAKSPNIDAVNIIAHSMGNDPLIGVLKEQIAIKENGGQPLPMKLKEVVFASADVPRDTLSGLGGKLSPFVRGGGTVYVSGKDIALRLSDGLAQERAGYVSSTTPPVIVRDLDTIDMTNASWIFSLNHSTFSERRHIIDDLELLFSKGQRPPHERYKVFRPVDLASGQRYWRYEQ